MSKVATLLGDQVVLRAADAAKPKRTFVDQLVEAAVPNPFGRVLVFLDFEYNDNEVVCAQMVIRDAEGHDDRAGFWFVGEPETVTEFRLLVGELIALDAIFVGHAVGIAEMTAMLRLGVDIRASQWIDLFTEAKMIGQNHKYISFFELGLLKVAKTLGVTVPAGAAAHKDAMRNLILAGGPYTPAERTAIMDYCYEDTAIMPDILSRLHAVHVVSKAPTDVEFYLQRGLYILCTTLLNWRTRGLAVDVDFWNGVARYRQEIRDTIARRSNEHYRTTLNHEFFTPDKKRSQTKYVMRRKLIAEWADKNGVDWQKTSSGAPRLDHEYFDEQVRRIPALARLKQDKDALQALGAVNLNIDEHGYVKPGSRTYHTVTGRNQPMVKEDFIFNMAPVFRVAGTKPKPGMALIAADWSKQEPAIAISLSGDDAYLQAYMDEDLYLACAMRAGAVDPVELANVPRNKEGGRILPAHIKLMRQAFKAAMLGIGYGMGFATLSKKIHAEVNSGREAEVMTLEEAERHAAEILSWHRSTFHKMWGYLDSRAGTARSCGWITAEDGWLAYVNQHTKATQLINFPIQANGAAMLRECIISLCRETDLDVPFTLHDAVYVNCRVEDIEATKTILKTHMERAAHAILADNPVPIVIDFKVITEDQPLRDDRANELLPFITETLAALTKREAELDAIIQFGGNIAS